MPNGFYGSKKKWEQLEKPLLEIDNKLNAFAKVHKLIIEKNYHNWPSRSIKWKSQGIKRIIQIYLKNESKKTYNFWICAYKDKDNARYWKNKSLKKNVLFSEISDNIEELLKNGYNIVESWLEKDFEKA